MKKKQILLSTLVLTTFFCTNLVKAACAVAVDLGNNDIVNVADLQVSSINNINQPTTDGTSGQFLTADGSGGIVFANNDKLYYSIQGSVYPSKNPGSSYYAFTQINQWPAIYYTIITNDQANTITRQFNGYFQFSKAGTYEIYCRFPFLANTNSYLSLNFRDASNVDQGWIYRSYTESKLHNFPHSVGIYTIVEIAQTERIACVIFDDNFGQTGLQGALYIKEL